jgi:hypothetical protein
MIHHNGGEPMAEEKPQASENIYQKVRREALARQEQERQRRARLDELKERQDPERLGGNDR